MIKHHLHVAPWLNNGQLPAVVASHGTGEIGRLESPLRIGEIIDQVSRGMEARQNNMAAALAVTLLVLKLP